MIGVIGSGFGLYGHLPAFAKTNSDLILLPYRYKEKFDQRQELKQFGNQIKWVDDEEEVIKTSSVLSVSICPHGQSKIITSCLKNKNLAKLYLEKPLGENPLVAGQLLTQLVRSKIPFRINYIFLFTKWFQKVEEVLKRFSVISVKVEWYFMAHHYREGVTTWKREHSSGGSVIRFYGIHIIAVLAMLGFKKIKKSVTVAKNDDDIHRWMASFTNDLTQFDVIINSKAPVSSFRIDIKYVNDDKGISDLSINWTDPFCENVEDSIKSEEDKNGGRLDYRVELIRAFHASIEKADESLYLKKYLLINELWTSIENINVFKIEN